MDVKKHDFIQLKKCLWNILFMLLHSKLFWTYIFLCLFSTIWKCMSDFLYFFKLWHNLNYFIKYCVLIDLHNLWSYIVRTELYEVFKILQEITVIKNSNVGTGEPFQVQRVRAHIFQSHFFLETFFTNIWWAKMSILTGPTLGSPSLEGIAFLVCILSLSSWYWTEF